MAILQYIGRLLVLPLVAGGLYLLVAASASNRAFDKSPKVPAASVNDIQDSVARIDAFFERRWKDFGGTVAQSAPQLQLLRRLSLSVHGTIPSLEEIRAFENDSRDSRWNDWVANRLADRRYADYWAERFARALVGVDNGQFIVYRRDRFVAWLAEQLQTDQPYPAMVRSMISEQGLWTERPASNFVMSGVVGKDFDEAKLAGRTARGFLGQRIDCAECHNHPFAEWKQSQFEGLAAFFAECRLSPLGVEDRRNQLLAIEDRTTLVKRIISPAAPFHPEWLPSQGTARSRLAAWLVHPENRRVGRALVNRVWGLMFGRPWVEPVDDIPDPGSLPDLDTDLLDILEADFRTHGYSLKRLVRVIAATKVFQLDSVHPAYETGDDALNVAEAWSAFPITRLRPEQLIGSMLQAASIQTIDQNSHLLTRIVKFFRQSDFVKEFGDLGVDELLEHNSTIPQALLRMNGRLAREIGEANVLTAAGRIAQVAPTDADCVDTCFLTCFTRRPQPTEQRHFVETLKGSRNDHRLHLVEDLYWSLFNAPEFSWQH